MFSTSRGQVCLWGIRIYTRGRMRLPLTSGVSVCKTVSKMYGSFAHPTPPPPPPPAPGGRDSNAANQNMAHRSFVREVADSITEKLGGLQPFSKSHIHEVPEGPCKVNVEAYTTPMLVSIGPYHLENPKLRAMDEHKLRYLQSLLDRKKHYSLEIYISELNELEAKARQCYAESIDLNRHKFVEMMLLDGSFIIEFVRKGHLKHAHGKDIVDDPIFNVDGREYQIRRDIMLHENQLPHFVLSTLYNMSKHPEEEGPFKEMAMPFFTGMLLKPHPLATK